jgi:hypothetical protein
MKLKLSRNVALFIRTVIIFPWVWFVINIWAMSTKESFLQFVLISILAWGFIYVTHVVLSVAVENWKEDQSTVTNTE